MKSRRLCFGCVLTALMLVASLAQAEVKCGSPFGDHMVLQRDAAIPVWGVATAGETVTVKLADQSKTATADDKGKWSLKLDAIPATATPMEMTVSGSSTLKFSDILVGDVWICSGQSNMGFTVKGADNSAQEIAAANYPLIRLAGVAHIPSPTPIDTCKMSWAPCTPESIPSFSAVGYFFGRHVHKALNIPVGLINTSWGGTVAEAWTARETLQADPDFAPILERTAKYPAEYPKLLTAYEAQLTKYKDKAAKAKAENKPTPNAPRKPAEPDKNQNSASFLYNGMILPLQPYAIKGAIWYQGESNGSRGYQYRKLLPAMIGNWRQAWGQGDFPFLIVQLANYGTDGKPEEGSNWAELREAQLITTKKVPNTGLAVTIDIGNPKDVHPTNKQDVGKRLGLAAEKIAYGRDVVYSGPLFTSCSVQGSNVRLKFKHVGSGLVVKGEKLEGFTVAGEDRKFVPADATIDGETVVVRSDKVASPVAVRYGWLASPTCTLFNKEGLPASPFRTDEWPGLSVDVK